MTCKQDKPSGPILASKPSVAFSTASSAASATSAATSRSGGSKLLFGEIDTSSERSSEVYASVCSFVLCDSSTFLKFWLEDQCRDRFLSHLAKSDLANLRLTCHDFSVRAAPTLFNDISITFRTSTFTKPARLAALDRLGFYIHKLKVNIPHSSKTFLPPLVDPNTGDELSFTYTPQIEAPTAKNPKYGDLGTTEILTRQWPALFHAATNVPAFIRAFSSFVNLTHLTISCPGYDNAQRYRRSTVDFALISLRIAVERNNLNALESLTLSPIHPGGVSYLLPRPGYGATPRSARQWSRIKHLTVHADSLPPPSQDPSEPDHFKVLQTYLRNFQSNLLTLAFRWNGAKGPIPIRRSVAIQPEHCHPPNSQQYGQGKPKQAPPLLHFPHLQRAEFENVKATAKDISAFADAHKRTIEELNLEDVQLVGGGKWDDALAPLTKLDKASPLPQKRHEEIAEIPIMLSPTTRFPVPMHRVEVKHVEEHGGRSLRLSRWLSVKGKGRVKTPGAACGRKVREGLREVLRGGGLLWR